MEKYLNPLSLKAVATGIISSLFLLTVGYLIFLPAIDQTKIEINKQMIVYRKWQALEGRKENILSEWETKKSFFNSSSNEDPLMPWVKDLMSFAQNKSFVLEKIEPQGIKRTEAGRKAQILLSFAGDINVLVDFIFYLKASHPLAEIESFMMRQEENSKAFSYEMLLSKAVPS